MTKHQEVPKLVPITLLLQYALVIIITATAEVTGMPEVIDHDSNSSDGDDADTDQRYEVGMCRASAMQLVCTIFFCQGHLTRTL